MKSSPEQY